MLTRAALWLAALCVLAAAGAEQLQGRCAGDGQAAELSLSSGLNATGHWLAEVRLQHAAEAGQRPPVHLQLRRWARRARRAGAGEARVVTLQASLSGPSASPDEQLAWEEHASDSGFNGHACVQPQDTPQSCPSPPPCPSAPKCPPPCPTCPTNVPTPVVTHQCPSPCPSPPPCPSLPKCPSPCPTCPTHSPTPVVTHQCPSPCPSPPPCPSLPKCPSPCPTCPTHSPTPVVTRRCPSPCPACPACPARPTPGYVRYAGHGAYRLHLLPLGWFGAQATCEREGAHLAVINSQGEADVLAGVLKAAGRLHPTYVLLGFHDTYVEGAFYTVLDEPLNASGYSKWLPGEPNNAGNENCGGAYVDGMRLNDHKCSAEHPFLCEMP